MSLAPEAVATWIAPIAGASPAGSPARGDEDYEKLRLEIGKLSAAAGGAPSWNDVLSLATTILTTKSKDLLVASYLCAALLEKDGPGGLRAGLQLYRDLVATYWAQLYPEADRVRARVNAIQWLLDHAAKAIARWSPSQADAEALSAAVALLADIEAQLAQRLGDAAPAFGAFRHGLKELASQAQAPAQAEASAPTVAAASAPTLVGAAEIASEQDARRALAAATESLRAVASHRRRASLADASAYRLLRLGAWLAIERVPPATDGKTLVAPPGDLKRRIEQLAAASNWANLVELAEKSLYEDTLFWLDLQWHVAHALGALGGEHQAARRVVVSELGRDLARLSGLEKLRFRDGTPFADDRTQAWIEDECKAPAGDGARGRPAMAALPAPEGLSRDVVAEVERELVSAQLMAGEDELMKGLSHLASRAQASATRRERFLWRLAQARLLSYIGRLDVARPQLEALDEELGRVPVADWDVAMTVDVLRALLDCYRKLMRAQGKPTAETAARARDLYERLARIDPAVAIGLEAPV